MKRLLIHAVALTCLAALPAFAQQRSDAGVRVEDAWARASAGAGTTAAAYMTLANDGDAADRLVGAETEVAGSAELHTHVNDGGVMRMRPVEGVALPPGDSVVMKPGGLHVMLGELRRPLREGDRFPLTLTFERAGAITVEVAVQKLGASGPGGESRPHRH